LLELVGLVVSVGLADSVNPTTVGPALYLATGPAPVRHVLAFTAGVFGVFLAGGLLIALGSGEVLLSLVPHPSATTKHLVELVAGATLIVAGILLWLKRRTLAARPLPGRKLSGGSAFLLGAGISVVELPTAIPYLAVIAAVVGSGASVVERIELLAIFCAVFCAPLLAIVVIVLVAGERAKRPLERAGDLMQAHWPEMLAALLLVTGIAFAVVGGVGLGRR
jgi:cytochrome c biogenesis protein CcdA